ncbi:MAG: cystathionine beta-synthase [Gemmatimonadetes bacterium]|nr:cystathionine beta-synthase [Gemmatimonadota bacterium]
MLNSILDAIGRTPLVRLNKITAGLESRIFAKLEFMNPTGSVKDRIARHMIEKAETEGKIEAGQLIIESSSGNTAVGLALVAIQKGYRLKVVVRDSLSKEKLALLRALDVDVHAVDSTLPPESPESYNNITPRMAAATPGAYFPDQHNSPDNNEAHYLTTGPEIWDQMDGKIDYLVAGIGTGGTVCGTSRFLKERDPRIKTIAVDPEGSIFYDHFHHGKLVEPHTYVVEGLGDEFLIDCPDFQYIDDIYRASDHDIFHHARLLVRSEGILGGGSSGAALWASMKLANSLDEPARIVTIFPDSATRYLGSVFNDDWMKERGFLD